MKLTYSLVRDPRWANPDHSAILCVVKFDHVKQEAPFTATPNDVEPHGRELFEDCVAGKYGPVGEFQSDTAHEPAPTPAPEPQLPLFDQWPEMLDFLNEANRENSAGTVRGQVLVWSSMIELLIGRLVEAFLIEHQITKDLLGSALSTFEARIDAAFSLGLITKSEHRTCDKIRDIRNRAAHSWSLTLDDSKVKSALRSLYDADHADTFEWVEDIEFLIKFIYSGSCASIAMRLAARIKAAADTKRVKLEDETP